MGSGSPSGLEFKPTLKACGWDMIRIVPVMLSVKTFFDGRSILSEVRGIELMDDRVPKGVREVGEPSKE
jgi:hypothetical protein